VKEGGGRRGPPDGNSGGIEQITYCIRVPLLEKGTFRTHQPNKKIPERQPGVASRNIEKRGISRRQVGEKVKERTSLKDSKGKNEWGKKKPTLKN